MPMTQTDNFIAILRAACGNGRLEIRDPDWAELARLAQIHTLTAIFYVGAQQYPVFAACPAAALPPAGRHVHPFALVIHLQHLPGGVLGKGLQHLIAAAMVVHIFNIRHTVIQHRTVGGNPGNPV